VLIRALVSDLVLHKNEALIMDMEAGIEHLGRGTARGVDALVVVVEPGQRSIDSAHRIIAMAEDIGLKNIKFVLNKVASSDDEGFVRKALDGREVLGVVPYCEDLRRVDRNGKSVLDGIRGEVLYEFETILKKLISAP
jgi:CO dehydrogenase maturation factor